MTWASKLFGGSKSPTTNTEINDVEAPCFSSEQGDLLLANLYSKILYEAMDRASLPKGVNKDAFTLTVYDSYSPAKRGLVTIVTEAMVRGHQRFYEMTTIDNGEVLYTRILNPTEAYSGEGDNAKLRPDVLELDFRDFYESDLLRVLYTLLNLVITSMSRGILVSQAVVFKIHELTQMIHNEQNMEAFTMQVTQLNESLVRGQTGVIDAESDITMPTMNVAPSQEGLSLVYGLIAHITGLPKEYLFSDVVGGLGDTSNSEEHRLNVALKRYFYSILSGTLYTTWNKVFEYKMLISNVEDLNSLITLVETTTILTDDAKTRVVTDNTVFNADDVVFSDAPTQE
jgi:hypothetical protein